MTIDAPAKLNLGLHVIRKRPDGFHDIETVMAKIGWYDTIDAELAEDLVMSCDDPSLPIDDTNLCLRAAHALADKFEVSRGAHLALTKRVPFGAGLGGGSSDAASTLQLLSRLWKLAPTHDELVEIAESLGSDVPFFLHASPALARGRGERLASLASIFGRDVGLPFSFVVVKPNASISTADAYRWVEPSEEERADVVDVVASCDLDRWSHELQNDFEASVIDRVPEIEEVKQLLIHGGAGYSAMSGSGSAVFGVFEDPLVAETTCEQASSAGFVSWVGRCV